MRFNTFIVLLTTVCFLQSFVAAPLTHALSAPLPAFPGPPLLMDGLFIPTSLGRITGGACLGSQKIVINIQDLHCHPEVQRGISGILGEIDARHPLKAVFVEGGYGAIDTSWLSGLATTVRGTSVIETMVNQGWLTGPEYFAATHSHPGILKGLEDEQVHKGNVRRLGMMLDNVKRYESVAATLDGDRAFLEAKYFSARNRRFNEKVRQHAAGDIATEKYYTLLEKYVEKINARPDEFNNVLPIDMARYPNMRAYLEARRLANRLSHPRASRQLQAFIGDIRRTVSYNDYAALLQATDNFKNTDRLYALLAPLARGTAYAWERYPDVQIFLQYVEQERAVNPVAMIKEEKRLVEEIRGGLARDISELEVSFAVDFYRYFNDYLFNRLSADDYQYFAERVDHFKRIWTKYTYVDHLAALETDCALLDEYYRVNTERNRIFLRALSAEDRPSERSARSDGGILPADSSIEAVIRSLNHNTDIIILVSGGFHTEGMEQLLRDNRISFLTITPTVTRDIAFSRKVYRQMIGRQAAELASLPGQPAGSVPAVVPVPHTQGAPVKHSDALGATIASCQSGMERFQAVAAALMQEAAGNLSAVALRDELEKIDRQMGRNDAFRVTDGHVAAVIDGNEIQLPAAGVAEHPAANAKGAPALSQQDVSRMANAIKYLAAWVFSQPQAVEDLFPMLVTAMLWLAEHNIIVGDGPIPEMNAAVVSQIADAWRTDASLVARLPAPAQKALYDTTVFNSGTKVFTGALRGGIGELKESETRFLSPLKRSAIRRVIFRIPSSRLSWPLLTSALLITRIEQLFPNASIEVFHDYRQSIVEGISFDGRVRVVPHDFGRDRLPHNGTLSRDTLVISALSDQLVEYADGVSQLNFFFRTVTFRPSGGVPGEYRFANEPEQGRYYRELAGALGALGLSDTLKVDASPRLPEGRQSDALKRKIEAIKEIIRQHHDALHPGVPVRPVILVNPAWGRGELRGRTFGDWRRIVQTALQETDAYLVFNEGDETFDDTQSDGTSMRRKIQEFAASLEQEHEAYKGRIIRVPNDTEKHLMQLMALTAAADVVITENSGVTHLADFMGKPCASFYEKEYLHFFATGITLLDYGDTRDGEPGYALQVSKFLRDNCDDTRPRAVSALLRLIALYADPRMNVNAGSNPAACDARLTSALLVAA